MAVYNSLIKGFSFLFFTLFIGNSLFAETKKDTLIFKTRKDTFKLEKAQILNINNETHLYFRPKPFQFLKYVPSDLYTLTKTGFSKQNLPKLGIVLASSAILIAVDQPIIDAAQQFGRYINLAPQRRFKTVIEADFGSFQVPVLDLPQNLNSAMYFLGEGWPSILLASSMWGYGLIANDYRARQTSSQLSEMFFTLAISVQFVKRITGRESPFRASKAGGDWHLFPSPAHYQTNVSKHDAFPSGHLATAMATVTILSGNYPEKKYIKPVGYSIMGLIAYSMLNNEVHWMGDYPLAIAIGYTCGKIALSRGKQIIPNLSDKTGSSSAIFPMYINGNLGLSYRATF